MILKYAISKNYKKAIRFFVSIILILLACIVIYVGLRLLPLDQTSIAIDWKGIWLGLKGGKIHYGTGIRNPPWSLLPVVPLGLLPYFESWLLISMVTLIVMVVSVPHSSKWYVRLSSAILLSTSFPAVRHLVDGNLEALIILGVLMLLSGYASHNPLISAFGFLLSSAKPQETWIFLLLITIRTFSHWKVKEIIVYFAVIISIVIPTMLMYGSEWVSSFVGIPQMGSIMDSSLIASMGRLGIPSWGTFLIWVVIFALTLFLYFMNRDCFSRIQAAFLVSASLLLSPYAAGNSLVTIVAIGIIPLLFKYPIGGCILMVSINLQYIFPSSFRYEWGATYGMVMFLLSWLILGLYMNKSKSLDGKCASQETAKGEIL